MKFGGTTVSNTDLGLILPAFKIELVVGTVESLLSLSSSARISEKMPLHYQKKAIKNV